MKRHLLRAGAVALAAFIAAVLIPSGPASAAPNCDQPVPPPACGGDGGEDPPVWDSAARGALDNVAYLGNAVRVGGWAADADAGSAPISVHVYQDGAFAAALTANGYRPDVAQVYPSYGAYRGYQAVIPAGLGTHQVCAYAISVVPAGAAHPGNPQLGCRTYTATLAAPSNLRNVSWDQATGTAVIGFTDNSVEETGFRITIRTQHWEQYTDPRWGQLWRAYYTERSFTAPGHAGTGEVTASTTLWGSDCRTTVVATAGAFTSPAVSTGWC
ncbi:hypothetical protein ABZS66_24455 [Dactylosporangium sp. NPDC005572]|uniref:hypothetical protein n=1 Tax=Dactylosporangium sp. NPDC005572 TaxID=3156889 RepID=UPI0033AD3752